MRRFRGSPYAKGAASPLSENVTLIRTFNSETNPARPVRPSPLARSGIQDMPLDMIDRIRAFPLFQSAPDSFLTAIGAHLRPQLHSPHDTIVAEGDAARAMYWLVRGAVAVTSRDGESTYAELKPGAFFGEIGVLMSMPRTASIVARTKCLLLVLTKEDLHRVLPDFPEVEQAIREEAHERLTILERQKKTQKRGEKRGLDDHADGPAFHITDSQMRLANGEATMKRRKSPSPGLIEAAANSALGTSSVHVRQLLRELPLFSGLPSEMLHFLGLNTQMQTYPPFADIIKQNSQGKEVFFILRGEVEVIDEEELRRTSHNRRLSQPKNGFKQKAGVQHVKARLRQGNYFGEVVSLSLAPKRTATVRSVSSVECLVLTGPVLEEFWKNCPASFKSQIEKTARQRLKKADQNDVVMADANTAPQMEDLHISSGPTTPKKATTQIQWGSVDYSKGKTPGTPKRTEEITLNVPVDPDPYLIPDLDNVKSRSRRSSLAPPNADVAEQGRRASLPLLTITSKLMGTPTKPKRPKLLSRHSHLGRGPLPDSTLVRVLAKLDLPEVLRLRCVSKHWDQLLRQDGGIFSTLDLTPYNRIITDNALRQLAPFVGQRPKHIDITNCFHITDEGFNILAANCAANVITFSMRSVWEVSAAAIHEMVKQNNGLVHLDLSNCRKVNDALLMHVVGNIPPPAPPITAPNMSASNRTHSQQYLARNPHLARRPPPATPTGPPNSTRTNHPQVPAGVPIVLGAQALSVLTLSYCKHVTDRTMAHLALFARHRLTSLDLTRCTTITDAGFDAWGAHFFPALTTLILADCTYLSDAAIVALTNAAPYLRHLDLGFCCALSDTATEVLALGCVKLEWLCLAFCGSAVSDGSLRTVGMHLSQLKFLSVRGCIRVTGVGVEAVVEGCRRLEQFDVSQCRNLVPWLESGMRRRVRPGVDFETVAGYTRT